MIIIDLDLIDDCRGFVEDVRIAVGFSQVGYAADYPDTNETKLRR